MWFCGSVTEWLPTPFIIHHACLPIRRTPSLSHSHKLWAWLAISTAEIWDACNYHTIFIYSNQPDPNLYFPEAPTRLLASSYLPGRHSQRLCFLIRPRCSSSEEKDGQAVPVAFRRWKVPTKFCPNINTDRLLIQTLHSVLVSLAAGRISFF